MVKITELRVDLKNFHDTPEKLGDLIGKLIEIKKNLSVLELIPPIEPQDENSCNEVYKRLVRYIEVVDSSEIDCVYEISDLAKEGKFRTDVDGWSPLIGKERFIIRDGKAIRISPEGLEEVQSVSRERNYFS